MLSEGIYGAGAARRHVADGLEGPLGVESINRGQRCEFHGLQMFPRSSSGNHLRPEEGMTDSARA
jgi:hypothetical protein